MNKMSKSRFRFWHWGFRASMAISGLFWISLQPASAAELSITAEFKPSATNPSVDKFTNTTEKSGICKDYATYCREGVSSVMTDLKITDKHLIAGSTNNDERTFQALDNSWKNATLIDNSTGKSIEVKFRLMLISQKYKRSAGGLVLTDFNSAGRSPQGGCGGTMGAGGGSYYFFGWDHSNVAPNTTCYRPVSNMNYTDIEIDEVSLGYEMTSNTPMDMPNGTYNGTLHYTVGKGKQIDLGAANYSNGSDILTVNIAALVEHELRFQMTGSSKVVMIPPNGWDEWRSSGASQFTLEGTGHFSTTASAPFSMYMECEHQVLNSCALQMEGSDTLVQIATTVTVPGLIRRSDSAPITNWALYTKNDQGGRYLLEPSTYINAVASTIKFSVSEIESLRMGQFPGSTWRGSATLVFDAELSNAR